MEKVFLTGIKHSGKTTLMKSLSERLGLEGTDSDDLLSSRFSPLTVREWYGTHGKERFMEEELRAVESWVSGRDGGFVMSLGGGACDNAPLMELIRKTGITVYIRRPEHLMLPVILKDGIPPFLDAEDPAGSFHDLYARRDALYRAQAALMLGFDTYGDTAKETERLVSLLREAM